MEFLFPDADGGIRPDHVKRHSGGNLVGSGTGHARRSTVRGIALRNIEGALVDVHPPNRGIGGLESHRDGEGTPSASQVQKRACWGKRGSVFEQYRCSGVEVARAERATGALQNHLMTPQGEGMRGGSEGCLGVL